MKEITEARKDIMKRADEHSDRFNRDVEGRAFSYGYGALDQLDIDIEKKQSSSWSVNMLTMVLWL